MFAIDLLAKSVVVTTGTTQTDGVSWYREVHSSLETPAEALLDQALMLSDAFEAGLTPQRFICLAHRGKGEPARIPPGDEFRKELVAKGWKAAESHHAFTPLLDKPEPGCRDSYESMEVPEPPCFDIRKILAATLLERRLKNMSSHRRSKPKPLRERP